VEPAALLGGVGEHLAQRAPEPKPTECLDVDDSVAAAQLQEGVAQQAGWRRAIARNAWASAACWKASSRPTERKSSRASSPNPGSPG
jgi:hypothetical protein